MAISNEGMMRRRAETESDPRWARVLHRDGSAEDAFFYSVETSGIYCRPDCAARRPNPENVRFHATAAEAEAAGFRPCRRCRPDRPPRTRRFADVVAEACRRLEAAAEPLSTGELARAAGLSASHFHRVFKAQTGVTPRAYGAAGRASRLRAEVARCETVTDAIYEAGFTASSRFYAHSGEALGMTPTEYRAGGANATIRFAVGECSLGSILVAMSDRGVCAITIGDDPEVLARDLQDRFPRAEILGGDADFEAVVGKVIGLVETPGTALDLPLDIRGTAFQRRVWEALRAIPVGETATYAEIAARIGAPSASRAVAGACAANALAVAIPCHRVVRADGSLSGYRWGVERKGDLLERERRGAAGTGAPDGLNGARGGPPSS